MDLPVPGVDEVLRAAVLEIEAHAAGAGWDQPARLFALVPTADLLALEPALAEAFDVESAPGSSLTPVEQEPLPADSSLEAVLESIEWPSEVAGCAAAVERLVLPPDAEEALPSDVTEAEAYAAVHPGRQEVRIVAGATRSGATHCTIRMRGQDDDAPVLESPDLVPALLELLLGTLATEETSTG